ncbi:MAG: sugar phosphate isomerase/epimerase [Planctomycetes bacterium]|nr:sugar phosphate isomerase/epimerase [Planctomycetota bacterium]
MKLSLSVRIVESACKTRLHIPFQELVSVAKSSGYDAICMRASAGGVDSPTETLTGLRAIVEDAGLQISMVTADVNVPLNNDRGPDSLRNIGPSLDVAEALGCDLIRVCLKRHEDIAFARTAADQAAKRGIRLAHQCHTATLFEEVDSILDVLTEVNRPNFGLIYEPANLLLCGQAYAADTLARLRPFLMNAYAQNHRLDQHGPISLTTYCRGEVRFHHLDPWDSGGVDFQAVFTGLHAIDYDGYFTIHQAQGITTATDAIRFATRCAEFVRSYEPA